MLHGPLNAKFDKGTVGKPDTGEFSSETLEKISVQIAQQ
jgi:hypothetical protein